MNRSRLGAMLISAIAASTLLHAAAAEPAEKASMTAWKAYLEFPLPPPDSATLYDLFLPPAVLDRSGGDTGERSLRIRSRRKDQERSDARVDFSDVGLNDLRLYDAAGKPVPYALRVLRPIDGHQPLPVARFNPSVNADGQASVSLDLGDDAKHNATEIHTSGDNYRRAVSIEGSDDNKTWTSLVERPIELLSFHVSGQTLVVDRFEYPQSRRRYVRVIVSPDHDFVDHPKLEQVIVSQTVKLPGVDVVYPADQGEREAVRTPTGPGSAWPIELAGFVPCARVSIDAEEHSFSRSYRLEVPRGMGVYDVLASGTWQREADQPSRPLEIVLQPEARVWKMRLVILDGLNAPLKLKDPRYSAAARELIFPARVDDQPIKGPMRLYVGNPEAQNPQYDFAKTLPAVVKPEPKRIDLKGAQVLNNPDYQPPPVPFTERHPWLVYLVLSLASVALLAILAVLARQALRRVDATVGGSQAVG